MMKSCVKAHFLMRLCYSATHTSSWWTCPGATGNLDTTAHCRLVFLTGSGGTSLYKHLPSLPPHSHPLKSCRCLRESFDWQSATRPQDFTQASGKVLRLCLCLCFVWGTSQAAKVCAGLKEGAKLLPTIGVLLIPLLASPNVLQDQMHQHEHLDITQSPFPGSLLYLIPRLLGRSNFFCKEMKGCSCQSQLQQSTRLEWALLLQILVSPGQGCVLKEESDKGSVPVCHRWCDRGHI